jgi:hypothetical protein
MDESFCGICGHDEPQHPNNFECADGEHDPHDYQEG